MYNWEAHIDLLEQEFTGDLYKLLFLKDTRYQLSLSGINEGITLISVTIWLGIIVLASVKVLGSWEVGPIYQGMTFVGFFMVLLFWFMFIFESKISSRSKRKMTKLDGELSFEDGGFWRRSLPK